MKVALFIPCLSEHLYPQSALSMVKVLRYIGADIEYVDNQTCCGQPAFNSGYRKEIIPIAERFIELFKDKEYIVSPSGSCTAMVRIFYQELDIRKDLHKARDELSRKIFEFTEFLVNIAGVDKLDGQFNHKVTIHDSCHSLRELGVREQPRELLRSLKDLELIEMEKSDTCCGFGGTFSYKFADLSVAMVARKCRYINESGAEYVTSTDSSCLMNIDGYLRKHNYKTKAIHIADILAQSLNL